MHTKVKFTKEEFHTTNNLEMPIIFTIQNCVYEIPGRTYVVQAGNKFLTRRNEK